MKKVLLIAAAFLLIQSCGKTVINSNDFPGLNDRLIPLESDSKGAGYLLVTTIGHLSSDCGGQCITINGTKCHLDCMGYGNVCRQAASVVINQVGLSVTATTTDTFGLTSEDFFLMPDRSLDYEDEKGNHIFLNIPGQMVYRDTATQQFTFTGLSFSSTAAYSNN